MMGNFPDYFWKQTNMKIHRAVFPGQTDTRNRLVEI